jgi:hypothetical protein
MGLQYSELKLVKPFHIRGDGYSEKITKQRSPRRRQFNFEIRLDYKKVFFFMSVPLVNLCFFGEITFIFVVQFFLQ